MAMHNTHSDVNIYRRLDLQAACYEHFFRQSGDGNVCLDCLVREKIARRASVCREVVERLVGDGEGTIACCADNTSSNTSMTKGLFEQLSQTFTWFFIGCCVHAMDLLCEDIAKLDEIASAISERVKGGEIPPACASPQSGA